MVTQVRLIDADTLERLPRSDMRRELVRGVLVERMPPGLPHGVLVFRLIQLLGHIDPDGRYGWGGTESGFILRRNPDTVRSPDIYFIRRARLVDPLAEPGFFEGAPDLVIEIVSPSNQPQELAERVADYLEAGTSLLWQVDPQRREVTVHRPGTDSRRLGVGDTLRAPDLLPELEIPVGRIFEL